MHVVLTRQADNNAKLAMQIKRLQGRVAHLPLLAIENLVTPELLANLQDKLKSITLGICISGNAAQILLKLTKLPNCRWACVGPMTARLLQEHVGSTVLCPPMAPFNSQALLNTLNLHNINLAKQYIMILAGIDGDRELQRAFLAHGATVTTLALYKRVLPPDAQLHFNELFKRAHEFDIILITCITSLVNLMRLAQTAQILLDHLPLLVVSQRIYAYAIAQGFKEVYVAKSIADEDILLALESYRCANAKIL